MGDGIRYNSASMQQTIDELTNSIQRLTEHKDKLNQIKQNMQGNWSGEEAEDAYRRIDENIKNVQDMIEIQTETRNVLASKKEGFDTAESRL